MTYTLHGDPAWIVTLLAVLGALYILTGIGDWIRARVSLDLHPLFRVIPRRFNLSVRWDRPHAVVTLPGGQAAVILSVYECDDAPGPVALVQPYDEDTDAGPTVWLPVVTLSALPRHSFRETLAALRSTEGGDTP